MHKTYIHSCTFSCRTNVDELAVSIAADEPLITTNVIPQLAESLAKLQTKISDANNHRFQKYKTLKTHLLPLTNIAFDKKGKRYFQPQLYFTACVKANMAFLLLKCGCTISCEHMQTIQSIGL
jgi:CMP-2-keto-3-deoxyoctulosonic acid synthetase